MALEEIKNHADLAVGLLLEQFKGKDKLESFLRALVGPIQDMEEVAHDLDTEMRLDNAAGAQLDMIGRIVKLARGPLGDEAYRTRLHARIRANRSEGTPDDVLAVLRLMVASNGISIEEYPTGMVARVAGTLAEDPDAIVAELRRTRPGAVPLHLEYTLAADAGTFAFADGDSEEVGDNGFGGEDLEILNSSFDNWTAGDPDDWSKTEVGGTAAIEEVGTGEGSGGTGTGSINCYAENTDYAYVEQALSTVVGRNYIIEIEVSYLGAGDELDFWGTGGEFFETYTASGTYQVLFVAAGATTTIAFGVNAPFVSIDDATVDVLSAVKGGVWSYVKEA